MEQPVNLGKLKGFFENFAENCEQESAIHHWIYIHEKWWLYIWLIFYVFL